MSDKQWICNNSTAGTNEVGASSWEILQGGRVRDAYCVTEERIATEVLILQRGKKPTARRYK